MIFSSPRSCLPWATEVGRLPEVTNGRFVEAKVEKRAVSIGQLWRSLTGWYRSRASVRRSRDRSLAGSRGASRDADPQRCARKAGFCSNCQPPCPPLSGGYRRLPTLAFDIGMTAISLTRSLSFA